MALLWLTNVDTFWATFGENWATFYSNIWSHWFETSATDVIESCDQNLIIVELSSSTRLVG